MKRYSGNLTEKVSVNVNTSTLAAIDLLVDNGYYSNRSDFINQALREAVQRGGAVYLEPDLRALVMRALTPQINLLGGHGELTDFYYASDYRPLGRGHALVWLPPEYDKSKQYNLLFCLHGGTDNEYYWTSDKGGTNDGCSADKVLDNAYAKGLMEDTIVVFTSGVINYKEDKEYPNVVENPLLTDFWKNHFLLEFEIINNLLPYMQQEYPVMTGPEHTGICGLSMGCAQTMEIGLKHPDLFSYVGCFSAGPFETDNQPFVTSSEDAKKLNEKLKLLFFITGENDHMMDDSMRNFVKTCDDFGVNHVFYEVPGRGHDDFCWDRCLYAFMKYAFK